MSEWSLHLMPIGTNRPSIAGTVVKVGGSLLALPSFLASVIRTIGVCSEERRLLVVPGGGPFADAVRELDRRRGLSNDDAHWMAVAAMDRSAHLMAERLEAGRVVDSPSGVLNALDDGNVPVLAPARWLRQTDPLPHTWDVTSDSIAAWAAGRVGARHLVLVKPPGAGVYSSESSRVISGGLVDACFAQALPRGMRWTIVPADRDDALARAIGGFLVRKSSALQVLPRIVPVAAEPC